MKLKDKAAIDLFSPKTKVLLFRNICATSRGLALSSLVKVYLSLDAWI